MLDVKLWKPDTCLPGDSCEIYYLIDDVNPGVILGYQTHAQAIAIHNARLLARPNSTLPSNNLGATHSIPPKLCAAHAALGQTPAMYAVVLEENRRKNLTLAEIQAILSTVTPLDYIWLYDANRILRVSIDARITLTAAQKTLIQTALTTRFGVGKVVLT